jgi:hypothetical protein
LPIPNASSVSLGILVDCAPAATVAATGSTAGNAADAAFAAAATGFATRPAEALALIPIIGTANAAIATTRTANNTPLLIVPLFIVISVSPLQISVKLKAWFVSQLPLFKRTPERGKNLIKTSTKKKPYDISGAR